MSILIKTCGLSNPETVEAAIEAGATHIGLNFYRPSPRYVTPQVASSLADHAADRAVRVGVFVDPELSLLEEVLGETELNAIQLHGSESAALLAQIKDRFGLPVWKVIPVKDAEDIARAAEFEGVADFLLFDAKTPKNALPGGMGISFDWSLLAQYRGGTPWGLAGGLDPDNVAAAIHTTGASLVDASSGLESAPGIKDVDLIRAFCKAAREASLTQ